MAWNLDSDRPIYFQLVERIQTEIVSGMYPCGYKLPSVRELAAAAGVNPNTMQKAFSELERSGLVITKRTSGRFVSEDKTLIGQVRNTLAKEQLDRFIGNMKELGYQQKEILALIKENFEEDIL